MNKKNDWDVSKPIGLRVEELVLEIINTGAVKHGTWIKNNAEDKKAPDIKCDGVELYGDVKCAFTPYPTNKSVLAKQGLTPAGLTVDEHITLDMKDVQKYADLNLIYFFALANYPGVQSGIYMIDSKTVCDVVKNNPGRTYSRSARSYMDKIAKVGIARSETMVRPLPFTKEI